MEVIIGFRVSHTSGYHFGGPNYKDSSSWGSILGSPYGNCHLGVGVWDVGRIIPGSGLRLQA